MNRDKWGCFWLVLLIIMIHKSQPQDTPYLPVTPHNQEVRK
jgi:hypothetical protein